MVTGTTIRLIVRIVEFIERATCRSEIKASPTCAGTAAVINEVADAFRATKGFAVQQGSHTLALEVAKSAALRSEVGNCITGLGNGLTTETQWQQTAFQHAGFVVDDCWIVFPVTKRTARSFWFGTCEGVIDEDRYQSSLCHINKRKLYANTPNY